MCTILAKRFPNIGWIGVKNRDRPLATRTKLLHSPIDNLQRVTLVDESTQWSEGMNSHGVSIISSSLTPTIGNAPAHTSKDGIKIRDALAASSVADAVVALRSSRIAGCVMIFDATTLWLIEGKDSNGEQIAREITEDSIARTNHGIWIPTAGYQEDSTNALLRMRRISSEARLLIADQILRMANNSNELMLLLAKQWTTNPQITTLRHPIPCISTRTTEQLMLYPDKKIILLRNTNGILDFNQQDANPVGSLVHVGIV